MKLRGSASCMTAAPNTPDHLRVKGVLGCRLCLLLPDAQCCLQLCFHVCLDSSIGSSHGLQECLAFVKVVDVVAAKVAAPALLDDCCMSVKVALQGRHTQWHRAWDARGLAAARSCVVDALVLVLSVSLPASALMCWPCC